MVEPQPDSVRSQQQQAIQHHLELEKRPDCQPPEFENRGRTALEPSMGADFPMPVKLENRIEAKHGSGFPHARET